MAITLFTVAMVLMAGSAGLLVASADIRTTRNAVGAAQVHLVAESGVAEALQAANGPGVVSFRDDVVTLWPLLFGGGARTFAPLPGFTYNVSPFMDPANPLEAGGFVATASGTDGVLNIVVARVQRSNVPSTSPGALYLATDALTNATFNGNAFQVNGNDRNFTGGAGPAPAIPGISTRNDTNTQEAINSLSSGQLDNVSGLGFFAGPPVIPSILTSPAAPSVPQLEQIVADLLARPGVVTDLSTSVNGSPPPFGTTAAPIIWHFPQPVTIKASGTASGAGIMIVDGDLTIQGNFSYKGLIIVRGRTRVVGDTEVTGNATLYGSLWTDDINLVVGGSALIQYSSQALALANLVGGGGALPAPLQVLSLADCSQVPSGAGGCP